MIKLQRRSFAGRPSTHTFQPGSNLSFSRSTVDAAALVRSSTWREAWRFHSTLPSVPDAVLSLGGISLATSTVWAGSKAGFANVSSVTESLVLICQREYN